MKKRSCFIEKIVLSIFTSRIFSQIKEMPSNSKYALSLKIAPVSKTLFNGVLLENWYGDTKRLCAGVALQATVKHQLAISVNSIEFANWKHLLRPDLTKIGEDYTYFQHFSFKVSAIVINFFN